ncbi:Uncharacterised protein [Mycolicibacterium vanbaalenii]|uniref:Lipopolysaccharide biosynthesis protein n=1 Tax=Mycolicibacterium vanbaalenii TaxID=110539 RepID=A0A5S9R4B5_MYCVN|nr:hypothetical protein [Mycolicibacterium vanbaalenii]CAA0128259.1 Uncharacterised protein [Mycolicibacterium vanbaalenii]
MNGAQARQRIPAWRRPLFWVVVVITSVLGVGAGVLWTARQDAGWESTGTVFVAFTFPATETDPFGGAQFVTQRIDTYAQLGQSPEVLQGIADDVGGQSVAELADNVSVEAVPGSVLIRATAHDGDRETSARLAQSLMDNLNRAAMAVEAGGPGNTSPIDLVPIQPPLTVPGSLLLTALAAAGGGLVGGAITGAVLGWLLCLVTSRRRNPRVAASGRHGRHRYPAHSATPRRQRSVVRGVSDG